MRVLFLTLIGLASLSYECALAHKLDSNTLPKTIIARQIAPQIYVAEGPQAFPSAKTAGYMNNPGFIVSSEGVIVIDPGSSVQIGHRLLEAIAKVTSLPVIAVFNTHVHGDHWLGNQAIRETFVDAKIYAHENMLLKVDQGIGEDWLKVFLDATQGATKGTVVTRPDIGLQGGEYFEFGDKQLYIHHPEKAHTDNDILLEWRKESALFTGDVATNGRVQTARPADSDILGQIAAVQSAIALGSRHVVPGHGSSGGVEILRSQLGFLQQLYLGVKKYYAQDLSDFDMREPLMKDLAGYRHWANFNEIGRVISEVYLQVEAADFAEE